MYRHDAWVGRTRFEFIATYDRSETKVYHLSCGNSNANAVTQTRLLRPRQLEFVIIRTYATLRVSRQNVTVRWIFVSFFLGGPCPCLAGKRVREPPRVQWWRPKSVPRRFPQQLSCHFSRSPGFPRVSNGVPGDGAPVCLVRLLSVLHSSANRCVHVSSNGVIRNFIWGDRINF